MVCVSRGAVTDEAGPPKAAEPSALEPTRRRPLDSGNLEAQLRRALRWHCLHFVVAVLHHVLVFLHSPAPF
eukprot:6050084-Pyramimonas_sp.AAC.1